MSRQLWVSSHVSFRFLTGNGTVEEIRVFFLYSRTEYNVFEFVVFVFVANLLIDSVKSGSDADVVDSGHCSYVIYVCYDVVKGRIAAAGNEKIVEANHD